MWADPDDLDELDDELLAGVDRALRARVALPTAPTVAELAALDHAVAARFQPVPTNVIPIPGHAAGSRAGRRARLGRVGAAAAVVVLFTGSAAAAATGGVALPRPVRFVAHAIGLPVDSPALDNARHHVHDLEEAVEGGDARRALRAARDLREAIGRLPRDEQDEVQADIDKALAAAAPLLVESLAADWEPGGVDSAAPDDAGRPAPPASGSETGSSGSSGIGPRDGDAERTHPTTPDGESAPPADSADATEASDTPDAGTGAPGEATAPADSPLQPPPGPSADPAPDFHDPADVDPASADAAPGEDDGEAGTGVPAPATE